MDRRFRAGVTLGALAALALAPVGGAVESPWPDAQHGWAIRCFQQAQQPKPRCRPGLYSTEDGGGHWRLIYQSGNREINGFLRTSVTSGVVSVDAESPKQYWTRDNGARWYRTRRLPSFAEPGVDVA